MSDPAEEASRCSICLDLLLSQPACVLRCGHVYHSACFQQWLLKSRQQCPECRAPTQAHELRPVEFDVVEGGAPQLSEEVRHLSAASSEERQRRQDSLLAEAGDIPDRIAEVARELAAAREEASTAKTERKEAERQGQQLYQELGEDRPLLEEESLRCQSMQEQIDRKESQQHSQQHQKLPTQSREGDEDVQLERRHLRSTHPADRAKQVHEALVAAHSQQIQSHSEFQRVQSDLAEAQHELKEERARVAELRKAAELDVLRRASSGSSQVDVLRRANSGSSQMDGPRRANSGSSQVAGPAAPAAPPDASAPAASPPVAAALPSQSSQGSARASAARALLEPAAASRPPKRKRSGPDEAQDHDDSRTLDLLYGAAPRRGAGPGFLSRRLPAPLAKPPALASLERVATQRGLGPLGPKGERTSSAMSAMARLFPG